MKKILKISSIALMLITALACENDDQTIVSATGGPELITPTDGATYVLLPENAASEATTLVWNHADFDVQTAANYEVEVALAGTDFATIVSGGSTVNSARFLVWTVEQLNTVALNTGIAPFEEGNLDIRIKSSLGNNSEEVTYSNKITIKVTPYTTETPKLYVIGDFLNASGYGANWTTGTNLPALASSGFGETDFEGYVYMNQPASEFKLLPTNSSFDGDYGDDGSFSGALLQEGEVNIAITGEGYYWIKADTDALTYSVQKTSWAITGSATPLGWPDGGIMDQDMTYNPTTKKWEITIVLTAGNEFKFRANDGWAINYGDAGADGILDFNDGTNMSVSATGTYLVELDLSNPRAYTYTATLQ
ncbi:SusE domain-containing protein [Flavobacterium sp. PLA-1-15]|uniref:SusE domain-containing protein n=1 Tax=Flavobacterium sp. PLA-1-15 TaxID=3380533 RepID=UPI003B7D9E53